jgi:elongation factor Ts
MTNNPISAELVRELRERTGAGIMECKKALTDANGNLDSAIEALRKSGLAKAAKKAGRTAAEGIIVLRLSPDQKTGVLLEINSETDFVARDQNFVAFANKVADRALADRIATIEDLLKHPYGNHSDQTIEQARHDLIAKLGENIQVRRLALLQSTTSIGAYKHGEKIGVLVQLNTDNPILGKDIAMHIAALKPQAIAPENISADIIAKEREIFMAQAKDSGKSGDIIEKMIEGRIRKFLNEISLVGQPFVKNPDESVNDVLKKSNAKVLSFIRFEVGEGIEKTTTDFAQEVMAQVRGT